MVYMRQPIAQISTLAQYGRRITTSGDRNSIDSSNASNKKRLSGLLKGL